MGAKKVNYCLIPENEEPYDILRNALQFHSDLVEARIALAWRMRTKEDVDGRIVLGKCVKVSDLQKEFAAYDFIVVLNEEYWLQFGATQKLALVDHELSHAAPVLDDDTGEQVTDERGRKVWRCRRHDLEEFVGVVQRHGIWKKDIEQFAAAIALARKREASLFNESQEESTDAVPMIHIDGDAECTECHKKGATASGLCIECVGDRIQGSLQ